MMVLVPRNDGTCIHDLESRHMSACCCERVWQEGADFGFGRGKACIACCKGLCLRDVVKLWHAAGFGLGEIPGYDRMTPP